MSTQNRTLTNWQLLCYGLLTTPLAIAGFTLVIYIPTFYATNMGLGLTLVGAVFMFGRIFDVVTDPVIGHLSDKTRHRTGPRLIWMVLGLPGFLASAWLLLSPPEGIGTLYLVTVSAAFFLFYTVVDVPYSSVGLEISPHIHERTYLASAKAVFQVIGALIASLVPILVAAQMGVALNTLAMLVLGLSLLGIVLFVAFVPRRVEQSEHAQSVSLLQSARFVIRNKPYRSLIAAFFLVQAANALTAGLTVLFVTVVIGRPDMIGQFFLLLFACTALFLPLWIWLSKTYSKHTAWLISIIVACVILLCIGFAGSGQIWLMAAFSALLGGVFGADAIMPTSMLADIVSDKDSQQSQNRAATLLAVKNAVSKLTFVFPMGLAFPMLDVFGLQSTGDNEPGALNALLFFFAGLPILLRLAAFAVLTRSVRPLNT